MPFQSLSWHCSRTPLLASEYVRWNALEVALAKTPGPAMAEHSLEWPAHSTCMTGVQTCALPISKECCLTHSEARRWAREHCQANDSKWQGEPVGSDSEPVLQVVWAGHPRECCATAGPFGLSKATSKEFRLTYSEDRRGSREHCQANDSKWL